MEHHARISVARFSSEPMNNAIFRANSLRNSRHLLDKGKALLLAFFTVMVSLYFP
jgi:hypothetical protein